MAKKTKKKSVALLPTIITIVCAVLMIVSFFTPFISMKGNVSNSTQSLNGIDLVQGVGSGDSVADITSNNGKTLQIKLMMESEETGAATYTLVIGAITGLIFGLLLLLFALFGMFSKSKLIRIGAKVSAGLGIVSGIMSIAAAASLAGKLTSMIMAVSVSVGGIMLLTVSIIAMVGLLVFKRN